MLSCKWAGSCEVALCYRMGPGLWAYASFLNIPCPQDIAPLRPRATIDILMDRRASCRKIFEISFALYDVHLYGYRYHILWITANTAQNKSPRLDLFGAPYAPILMACGPGRLASPFAMVRAQGRTQLYSSAPFDYGIESTMIIERLLALRICVSSADLLSPRSTPFYLARQRRSP